MSGSLSSLSEISFSVCCICSLRAFCSLPLKMPFVSESGSFNLWNTERRLRRHTVFTDKVLQKCLCLAHDTAEQIGQPSAFADSLAHFVAYLGLFDFQYLCLPNPRYESHICRPVPFLPCRIVGFDFFLPRIVLADFLCRQIHAVFIKDFQMLFGVGNVAVDKVCITSFTSRRKGSLLKRSFFSKNKWLS